jgi:hypothetical protein
MGAVRLARRVEEMHARRVGGSVHIVAGALAGAAAAGGGAGGGAGDGAGSAATAQARGGPRGSVSVPAPSTLAGVDARKTRPCDPAPGVRLVERNHEETFYKLGHDGAVAVIPAAKVVNDEPSHQPYRLIW